MPATTHIPVPVRNEIVTDIICGYNCSFLKWIFWGEMRDKFMMRKWGCSDFNLNKKTGKREGFLINGGCYRFYLLPDGDLLGFNFSF